MTERPLLILVHPGSACGSADFHHGTSYASSERAMLVDRLMTWQGDLVVADSDLSDELSGYPELANAIDEALARAASSGHAARLLAGDHDDDYDECDWVSQIEEHVVGLGSTRAIITGAWYHPDDDHGCVNAVYDALQETGVRVEVDESALAIDLQLA